MSFRGVAFTSCGSVEREVHRSISLPRGRASGRDFGPVAPSTGPFSGLPGEQVTDEGAYLFNRSRGVDFLWAACGEAADWECVRWPC